MRKVLCPGLDQTLAALLEDLENRGMLDETLVVVTSEHGRGPRVTDSPKSAAAAAATGRKSIRVCLLAAVLPGAR